MASNEYIEIIRDAIEAIIRLNVERGCSIEHVRSDCINKYMPKVNSGKISLQELNSIIDDALDVLYSADSNNTTLSSNNNKWASVDIKNSDYWKVYADSLRENLEFSDKTIEKQFGSCYEIVNQLVNPQTMNAKQVVKGLVYGSIQSGKTASMAGVIALYAAMQGELTIVLSGVTNSLWWQTSERLRRDLGIDDARNYHLNWKLVTGDSDHIREFEQGIRGLITPTKNNRVILFIKKNSVVLDKLDQYLFGMPNNEHFFANKSVLLIDDECDQATPDVSSSKENPFNDFELRSSINKKIVSMLRKFKNYSYIGYTATPYANILNEAPSEDSLYPKDFIVCLDENEAYFGPKKLFGSENALLEDKNECLLEYVHELEDGSYGNNDTELLRYVYLYYLASCACKRLRGNYSDTSMLIHRSQKTATHDEDKAKLLQVKETVDQSLKNKDIAVIDELIGIWHREKAWDDKDKLRRLFPGDNAYSIPSDKEILSEILKFIDEIKVVVDNSRQKYEDRLHYDPQNPGIYIVIGGNTLSRGLTIKGLLATVFLRNTKTYDNILQMGRWYGYRKGCEDLVRVWMPAGIIGNSKMVAGIDSDLRSFIMDNMNHSPVECPPQVRTCHGISICRKNAMKGAVIRHVNLFGEHFQGTIIPETNEEILNNNINAAKRFVSSLPVGKKNKSPIELTPICWSKSNKGVSFCQK